MLVNPALTPGPGRCLAGSRPQAPHPVTSHGRLGGQSDRDCHESLSLTRFTPIRVTGCGPG